MKLCRSEAGGAAGGLGSADDSDGDCLGSTLHTSSVGVQNRKNRRFFSALLRVKPRIIEMVSFCFQGF